MSLPILILELELVDPMVTSNYSGEEIGSELDMTFRQCQGNTVTTRRSISLIICLALATGRSS
jgi:hypothetical protein